MWGRGPVSKFFYSGSYTLFLDTWGISNSLLLLKQKANTSLNVFIFSCLNTSILQDNILEGRLGLSVPVARSSEPFCPPRETSLTRVPRQERSLPSAPKKDPSNFLFQMPSQPPTCYSRSLARTKSGELTGFGPIEDSPLSAGEGLRLR